MQGAARHAVLTLLAMRATLAAPAVLPATSAPPANPTARTSLALPAAVATPATAATRVTPAAGASAGAETLAHGRFKAVHVYRPRGDVTHFALFLSGDGGWNRRLAAMAAPLVADGTMVAGIDAPQLFADLDQDDSSCVFPDGDLENLSHYVQAYYKLPTYFTPILIGYSSGATLAYAVLAQAPPGIFAGALSLSFCTQLDMRKPLCAAENLRFTALRGGAGALLLPASRLSAPWIAVHGNGDSVCSASDARAFVSKTHGAGFVELPYVGHEYVRTNDWLPQFKQAYATIVGDQPQSLPPPPAALTDLPLVEVPASGDGDSFAVLLSGDGGWAGLDKKVASVLAERGIPIAGLDSLRYFWTARTPDTVAQDVDRLIRYYAYHWGKKRVLLIGYSQGADVLPFAVNRLPPATRALVALTVLIGAGRAAAFEFHVANWVGGASAGPLLQPEIDKLSAADTLCFYGDDDEDSICPAAGAAHVRVIQLPGGHHFGGDYTRLGQLILDHADHAPTPHAGAHP